MPMPALPSQHSGFRDDVSEPALDTSEHVSHGQPPPPGWPYNGSVQASTNGSNGSSGGAWYRHNPYLPRHSNSPSPRRGSGSRGASLEDPTVQAAKVPLPKGESMSPEKERSGTPAAHGSGNGRGSGIDERLTTGSAPPVPIFSLAAPESPQKAENFFRLSLRTEVQQRTDAIEAIFNAVRSVPRTRKSYTISLVIGFLSIFMISLMTSTPGQLPSPDVIRVASIARSFEPMMYYSENSMKHINELSETGVAVWDLGESVRLANLTSAPIIASELEELAVTIRTLSQELTHFFTYVDGDIDSILNVIDWAKRELSALPPPSNSLLATAAANTYEILARFGILVNSKTGDPTIAGSAVTLFFGQTSAEVSRLALKKAFREMLSTFEDSIANELRLTNTLFALFGTIDSQFLNLQRSTVREFDKQEQLENELLSTLWMRTVGGQRNKLRKFEKNKALLQSVRSRTVSNRHLVEEHNGKLMALKQSLEGLRRRLVSPLLKEQEDSHIGVAEQVMAIEGIWTELRTTRDSQKGRFMEALWGGSASRRAREIGQPGKIEAGP